MADSKHMEIVSYRDWIDPEQKNEKWIGDIVNEFYTYGGAKNLLAGKDVKAIFDYAAGNHSMEKFLAMFPERKTARKRKGPNVRGEDGPTERDLANHTTLMMDRESAIKLGMDLVPLGILQQPLASAIATLQKGLVSVSFSAMDATANKDRQMDLDRIRNRSFFNQAIAPAKQFLQMPLQDPGTRNNTPTVDIENVGLDPNKEDELNLYADLFYKLRPETAFEVAVVALQDQTDYIQKLDIQKRDQIYFGVDCCKAFFSGITELPDYDYVFPGHVYTPNSELPDFSDQPFRYIQKNMNVEQILNAIGADSMPKDFIQGIFENVWKAQGYKDWEWKKAPQGRKLYGIPIVYMEFKSFDVLRYRSTKTFNKRMVAEVVPFGWSSKKSDGDDVLQNKWPQQTYFAYWVPGTKQVLKCGKVEGLFRDKGKENKSGFTIQIEKSKDKSDVEQCITAVDDAQRAYIKLQLAVIMARPKGLFIDFKYIRHAVESMSAELGLDEWDLMTLMAVKNQMIGDTEGMDGATEGNFPPFREIPGGIGPEVQEYLAIIRDAKQTIAALTGFNDALTGQSPEPDQLVGIQKLLLQSSLTSLHYAQKAIKNQVKKTVKLWAPMIQYICKPENKNTAARKALENIIGAYKIDVIRDMDGLSIGQFGLKVEDAPDTRAQEELRQLLFSLLQGQRIELSDYFLVRRVMNYKEAEGLLVIKERKKAAEARKQQQDQLQAMQQVAQTKEQGLNQRAAFQSQHEEGMKQLDAQKDITIEQMHAKLQLMLKQMEGQIEATKKQMQGDQQREKLYQKHALEQFNYR